MMITGDARDTAVAIARDVNIFPKLTDAGENRDTPIKVKQTNILTHSRMKQDGNGML
jgi:magnesium-transporting ATPase (P-type)